MNSDILTVPTVTLALKVKKALSKRGIESQIIKIDASVYNVGCSYGIEFSSKEFYTAISIVKDMGITYNHLKKNKNDISR